MILSRLQYPIVLAPLAGGPSTPALAAAVSGAGGLGFLAAGYLAAHEVRRNIHAVRYRTSAPFGVNVFVPGSPDVDERAVRAYVERLRAEAARYGTDVGEPRFDDDDWEAKLVVLHEERVPVVSFTFGCPPADVVASLRAAGSEVWATVTDVVEARIGRDAGVDVLVLQGTEAGGHRASFRDRDDGEGLGLLPLIRIVTAEIDLPLVAAGGIGDGAAVGPFAYLRPGTVLGADGKTARVSSIFKWFAGDFTASGGVVAFIRAKASPEIAARLGALTDARASQLTAPGSVPSGLPVDD